MLKALGEEGDQLQPYYALIADHFYHAEEWESTLRFKELAGNAALAINANHEAVKCFETINEVIDHCAKGRHKKLINKTLM